LSRGVSQLFTLRRAVFLYLCEASTVSVFDDQFAGSQAALHRLAGSEVVYVPNPEGVGKDSNAVAIEHAIVGEEKRAEEPADFAPHGLRVVRRRQVSAIVDRNRPGFCGVEVFDDTGTVEIGELVYSIETLAEVERGSVVFHLVRTDQKTRTRKGFEK